MTVTMQGLRVRCYPRQWILQMHAATAERCQYVQAFNTCLQSSHQCHYKSVRRDCAHVIRLLRELLPCFLICAWSDRLSKILTLPQYPR